MLSSFIIKEHNHRSEVVPDRNSHFQSHVQALVTLYLVCFMLNFTENLFIPLKTSFTVAGTLLRKVFYTYSSLIQRLCIHILEKIYTMNLVLKRHYTG